MTAAVVVAFLVALIAGEVTDGSRWIGAGLARWAARRIYHADSGRASARAEEWEALISASFPTSLSAMCFGLGLAAAAAACVAVRSLEHVLLALRGVPAGFPGIEAAERERRDRMAEQRRAACLDLLSAASRLRLRAAGASRVAAGETGSYLADIRSLAADVQITAANVAMLLPAAQSETDRLAEASKRLADAMAARRAVIGRRRIRRPRLRELDESAKAFLRAAVAILRDALS